MTRLVTNRQTLEPAEGRLRALALKLNVPYLGPSLVPSAQALWSPSTGHSIDRLQNTQTVLPGRQVRGSSRHCPRLKWAGLGVRPGHRHQLLTCPTLRGARRVRGVRGGAKQVSTKVVLPISSWRPPAFSPGLSPLPLMYFSVQ